MTQRRRPLRATPKPVDRKPIGGPVPASSVMLEKGMGTRERGGGPGGSYWHVLVDGQRAGSTYINCVDEEPIGKHASVQIKLNVNQRGRHVGRIAFRLTCENSDYDYVYAHIAKSNTASIRAAEYAGFQRIHPELSQVLMVWQRHG